jgi:large subunit ribosomal protein L29
MKPQELRELDAEELGGRLKGARRELYELRFKLAVGQLDNHREIRNARKEIARILTVVHQRRLEAVEGEPFTSLPAAEAAGDEAQDEAQDRAEAGEPEAQPEAAEAPAVVETPPDRGQGQEEGAEAAAEDAQSEEGPARRRRGRRAVSEDEA